MMLVDDLGFVSNEVASFRSQFVIVEFRSFRLGKLDCMFIVRNLGGKATQ